MAQGAIYILVLLQTILVVNGKGSLPNTHVCRARMFVHHSVLSCYFTGVLIMRTEMHRNISHLQHRLRQAAMR